MITISKSKLKTQMLSVFRQIEETGEEVIVTDYPTGCSGWNNAIVFPSGSLNQADLPMQGEVMM